MSVDQLDCSRYVALDCEFVGVGPGMLSALGRCSITDYYGKVLCDIYAMPDEPITDYRTRWSGIRPQHMINAIPQESARNIIKKIIQDKIVVGHALHNDLSVLRMEELIPPDRRRDTSKCWMLREMGGFDRPVVSLKCLAQNILGRQIQKRSHDSIIDAQTAMDLFRRVETEWETELAKIDAAAEQLKSTMADKIATTQLVTNGVTNVERGAGTRKRSYPFYGESDFRRKRQNSDSTSYLSDCFWLDEF